MPSPNCLNRFVCSHCLLQAVNVRFMGRACLTNGIWDIYHPLAQVTDEYACLSCVPTTWWEKEAQYNSAHLPKATLKEVS